jgi:hypothetical protein
MRKRPFKPRLSQPPNTSNNMIDSPLRSRCPARNSIGFEVPVPLETNSLADGRKVALSDTCLSVLDWECPALIDRRVTLAENGSLRQGSENYQDGAAISKFLEEAFECDRRLERTGR